MNTFEREYIGMPVEPSDLDLLAKQYHEETEAFDRMVCTGPVVRGGIMPANGLEYFEINRHASLVRDRLSVEAMKLGYSRHELTTCIQKHSH